MMSRRTLLQGAAALLGGLLLRGSPAARAALSHELRWVAFYGYAGDEQTLAGYDIVVLDPGFTGSVPAVASRGARVCAYLSLGEIRTADPYFARLEPAALLDPNPAWPGTLRVDVRCEAWQRLVVDEIVPAYLERGFTGVMLDTIDTPPFLEQSDPVRYRGMTDAAVRTICEIAERHPGVFIIANRGYALLPRIVDCLGAIIAESLLTTPDPDSPAGFRWNDEPHVALQQSLLAPAQQRRPPVPVLTLDYWNPDDRSTIRQIYEQERQAGHHPYVATRELDQVVPEPV